MNYSNSEEIDDTTAAGYMMQLRRCSNFSHPEHCNISNECPGCGEHFPASQRYCTSKNHDEITKKIR